MLNSTSINCLLHQKPEEIKDFIINLHASLHHSIQDLQLNKGDKTSYQQLHQFTARELPDCLLNFPLKRCATFCNMHKTRQDKVLFIKFFCTSRLQQSRQH